MNWLDLLLLAILVFSVIMAARKGFSREVIGLAAAFLAFVLAMWFYGTAGSFLVPYVSSMRIANLLGFLLVVCAVLLGGSILGWIVHRFLRTAGLSFFDRLLGAAFGLVRGLLIAMAILTAFMAFGPQVESNTVSASMLNSRIAPYVLDASRIIVAAAPMELKSSFRKQYEQVKSTLEKSGPARHDQRPRPE
ncbi:MAG TPA: CvpA family protein [Bryobacteraceae bacterium]|nr:CvpA family protein [Bryobacteraceae bacterium]